MQKKKKGKPQRKQRFSRSQKNAHLNWVDYTRDIRQWHSNMSSPFLTPASTAEADSLAVLHLRRNQLIPAILRTHDDENLGYNEGKVINTRFGSFPHSTIIGKPWGSQILASNVDTGSRGRKKPEKQAGSLKRKANELESSEATEENKPSQKAAVAASSGFIHLLQPTPESWTTSLPHRTQVVYTPDYSYILHRLKVRPGSTIIEAGAGSGSFTHASARAVFNGFPSTSSPQDHRPHGKVCSFEFHAQRVSKIREEVRDHGLEEIVRVNHRDVYNDGFLLGEPWEKESPRANAIFLDLPAPWLALKHLVREPADGSESPLDPSSPIQICTFSPCLEQVQKTISTLRQHSWLFISMVEISHKEIEVRRQRYGVDSDVSKGGVSSLTGPKNVEESLSRLRALENRAKAFREIQLQKDSRRGKNSANSDSVQAPLTETPVPASTPNFREQEDSQKSSIPQFRQGTLVHRSESELKTHTSYLVFATLPRSWSEEDERRCRKRWPSNDKAKVASEAPRKSFRQIKAEAKAEKERSKKADATAEKA